MVNVILNWFVSSILTFLSNETMDFFEKLGCSVATVDAYFPGLQTMSALMTYVGVALIIVYGVFEAILYVASPLTGIDRKPTITILFRTVFWTAVCWNSVEIAKRLLVVMNKWYQVILTAEFERSSGTGFAGVLTAVAASAGIGVAGGSVGAIVLLIFVILIGIIVVNWIKVELQQMQRLMSLAFQAYTAPICIASGVMGEEGGVKAILYFKMLFGNVLGMFVTAWGLRIFGVGSTLDTLYDADSGSNRLGFIAVYLLILAWLNVLNRVDDWLGKLGWNTVNMRNDLFADVVSSFGTGFALASRAQGIVHQHNQTVERIAQRSHEDTVVPRDAMESAFTKWQEDKSTPILESSSAAQRVAFSKANSISSVDDFIGSDYFKSATRGMNAHSYDAAEKYARKKYDMEYGAGATAVGTAADAEREMWSNRSNASNGGQWTSVGEQKTARERFNDKATQESIDDYNKLHEENY